MEESAEHSENANASRRDTQGPDWNVTAERLVQLKKQFESRVWTEAGMQIDKRDEQ
jgi:hypothetical protein